MHIIHYTTCILLEVDFLQSFKVSNSRALTRRVDKLPESYFSILSSFRVQTWFCLNPLKYATLRHDDSQWKKWAVHDDSHDLTKEHNTSDLRNHWAKSASSVAQTPLQVGPGCSASLIGQAFNVRWDHTKWSGIAHTLHFRSLWQNLLPQQV